MMSHKAVLLLTFITWSQAERPQAYLNNLDVDISTQLTYDQILSKVLHENEELSEQQQEHIISKRQVRQLKLPQIEKRDAASGMN